MTLQAAEFAHCEGASQIQCPGPFQSINAASALIKAALGDSEAAKEHAIEALATAKASHSGFRYDPKVCLPKTSSRSTSHRINNIPVDLLWWAAREDNACHIVTFSRKAPLKNQTEFLVGTVYESQGVRECSAITPSSAAYSADSSPFAQRMKGSVFVARLSPLS